MKSISTVRSAARLPSLDSIWPFIRGNRIRMSAELCLIGVGYSDVPTSVQRSNGLYFGPYVSCILMDSIWASPRQHANETITPDDRMFIFGIRMYLD